jgi:hypothetical protein
VGSGRVGKWGQSLLLTLRQPWGDECGYAEAPRIQYAGARYHVMS